MIDTLVLDIGWLFDKYNKPINDFFFKAMPLHMYLQHFLSANPESIDYETSLMEELETRYSEKELPNVDWYNISVLTEALMSDFYMYLHNTVKASRINENVNWAFLSWVDNRSLALMESRKIFNLLERQTPLGLCKFSWDIIDGSALKHFPV